MASGKSVSERRANSHGLTGLLHTGVLLSAS